MIEVELIESSIRLVGLNVEAKPVMVETTFCVRVEDCFELVDLCVHRLDNFEMILGMHFLIKSRAWLVPYNCGFYLTIGRVSVCIGDYIQV